MKKTLKKVGILVAIIAAAHCCYGEQLLQWSFSGQKTFSLSEKRARFDRQLRIEQVFALEDLSGLRIYHYGIKKLNARYVIPTKENLLERVRTHRFFVERSALADVTSMPFYICEGERGHFYLIFQNRMRHFTVGCYTTKGLLIGGIKNGSAGYYPFLGALIDATFV